MVWLVHMLTVVWSSINLRLDTRHNMHVCLHQPLRAPSSLLKRPSDYRDVHKWVISLHIFSKLYLLVLTRICFPLSIFCRHFLCHTRCFTSFPARSSAATASGASNIYSALVPPLTIELRTARVVCRRAAKERTKRAYPWH